MPQFHSKGPFIFYEGGGAGGIWKAPFKNRMTPLSLPSFFTWCLLIVVIFSDDTPSKKFNPLKILRFLIFSIVPVLYVIVLTMKTILTVLILQSNLVPRTGKGLGNEVDYRGQFIKNTNQKKEKAISDLLVIARPENFPTVSM